MGTYDTRGGTPISPDYDELDPDICAQCGTSLDERSPEKLSDEGFCSWICVIGYHAEIIRRNIPNGNVLCETTRRQLIESSGEITAAVIQTQANAADRLDAYEAERDALRTQVAALENTIAIAESTATLNDEFRRLTANRISTLEDAIKLGARCFTCGAPASSIVKIMKGGCAAIDISADMYVGLCPQHEITIEPDEPMEHIAP